MFERYAVFIVAHARLVVAFCALVTVLAGGAIRSLTIEFDTDAAFPSDHPSVQLDHRIRMQFGGTNLVMLAVVPREGTVWQRDVLEAVRGLTQAAADLQHVLGASVISLASRNVRRAELQNDAIVEVLVMPEVPATPEEMSALREGVRQSPLLRGNIVSEDERAAIVLMDFESSADRRTIAKGVTDLIARFSSDDYHVYATGSPVLAAAGEAYIAAMPLYFGMAVAIMMVVLYATFGTLQGMLLPIITGVLSTIWGLGWMALTGVVLGIWNQSVPTLVIIIAAGHSAQMLRRYYEELAVHGDSRAAVVRSVALTGPAMAAAGATAALGFTALAATGIPGMVDLGLAACYGIMSAVFLELSFMPALRFIIGQVAPTARSEESRVARYIAASLRSARSRKTMLALGVAPVLAAALGMAYLQPARSSLNELPSDSPAARDLVAIAAHFPGTIPMAILFEDAAGAVSGLGTLRAIDTLASALHSDGDVVRTASLVDIVKEIHRTFAEDHSFRLPDDPELAAQLVFLGWNSGYERFINRAKTEAVLWAYLRTDSPPDVSRIMALARDTVDHLDLPPGVTVQLAGGLGPMYLALHERVTRAKLSGMLALLGAVYIIASLLIRSAVAGLFVILPLVVTLAVAFVTLATTGAGFDLVTASIMSIGVGIGADHSLYLIYRIREERRRGGDLEGAVVRAVETAGRTVLFVSVAVALGYLTFTASSYRAFWLAGLMTPVIVLSSGIAAVTVMPAALLTLRPAFLGPTESDS